MSQPTGAGRCAARREWLAQVWAYFGVAGAVERWAQAPVDQRRMVARTLGVHPESRVHGLARCSTGPRIEQWIDAQVAVPWDPCGQTTHSDAMDLLATTPPVDLIQDGQAR